MLEIFRGLDLTRKELLSEGSWVLIMGSNLAGGPFLQNTFSSYLAGAGLPEISVEYEKDIDQFADLIKGRGTLNKGRKPSGVILMNACRAYPNGYGMFVDTSEGTLNRDNVMKLCRKNKIPFKGLASSEDFFEAVDSALRDLALALASRSRSG